MRCRKFLLSIPLLLGVLGHRVLDPVAATLPVSSSPRQATLFYSVKEAKARGAVTDKGFVVFKGSTALKGATDTVTTGYTALRKNSSAPASLLSVARSSNSRKTSFSIAPPLPRS
jgi:hypothetical protein